MNTKSAGLIGLVGALFAIFEPSIVSHAAVGVAQYGAAAGVILSYFGVPLTVQDTATPQSTATSTSSKT